MNCLRNIGVVSRGTDRVQFINTCTVDRTQETYMATVYQDVVQAEIQRIQMVKQLIAHPTQFSLKVIFFPFNLGNSGHRLTLSTC